MGIGICKQELLVKLEGAGVGLNLEPFPLRRERDEQLAEETKRVTTLWEWKEC